MLHLHLIAEGSCCLPQHMTKRENITHTRLQLWCKPFMPMHHSSLPQWRFTASFPPWRRRHDSRHYLRVLTIGLPLPCVDHCFYSPTTQSNLIKTYIVCLTLHTRSYASSSTYYSLSTLPATMKWHVNPVDVVWWHYHLTIQRNRTVVITVVLPRTSFKPKGL